MSSPAAAAAAAAASPLGVLGCLEGVLECCRAGRAGRRGTARAGAAAAERGLRAARVGAAVGGLRAADAERGLRAAAAASAIAAHAVRVCQAARVLLARGAELRLCALCALWTLSYKRTLKVVCADRTLNTHGSTRDALLKQAYLQKGTADGTLKQTHIPSKGLTCAALVCVVDCDDNSIKLSHRASLSLACVGARELSKDRLLRSTGGPILAFPRPASERAQEARLGKRGGERASERRRLEGHVRRVTSPMRVCALAYSIAY